MSVDLARLTSRPYQVRRLVAWVLGRTEPDLDPAMTDEQLLRVLAGDRADDRGHLETLRAMNLDGLSREAPFAAAYHRGYVPTPEDMRGRPQLRSMVGATVDLQARTDGTVAPAAAAGAVARARARADIPGSHSVDAPEQALEQLRQHELASADGGPPAGRTRS